MGQGGSGTEPPSPEKLDFLLSQKVSLVSGRSPMGLSGVGPLWAWAGALCDWGLARSAVEGSLDIRVLSCLILDGFDCSRSEKYNFVDAGETWLKHRCAGYWVGGAGALHLS